MLQSFNCRFGVRSRILPAMFLPVAALWLCACGPGDPASPDSSGKAAFPDSPDAAVEHVAREIAVGNGGVLWQAMPAPYREDINQIVRLAGSKVDAEVYDRSFRLFGRLGELLESKQAFIANSELATRSAAEIENLEAALPALAEVIGIVASSAIATNTGLRDFQGQTFFETTVSDLSESLKRIASLSGEAPDFERLQEVEATIVESGEGTAVIEVLIPGEAAERETFQRVADRWVPAQLAADWGANIARARSQLEARTEAEIEASKPQVLSVIAMVEGVLGQIEAAETQQAFDQALKGAMMPLMGLMMMGQNSGGGTAPSPAPAPGAAPAVPSADAPE